MAYDSENYVVTDLPEPPTLSPEVRETLVKARKLIKQGWCQRQRHKVLSPSPFSEEKHEYCVLGALAVAAYRYKYDSTFCRATAALCDQLFKTHNHRNLVGFNDTTSQADVLQLFDDTLKEQA